MTIKALEQASVGALSAIFDLAIFKLNLALGLSPLTAAPISWFVALTVYFLAMRFWVYRDEKNNYRQIWSQFGLFSISALGTLGLTQLILYIFVVKLGNPPFLVKFLSLPVIFCWSFILCRFIFCRK